jgi:prepilin-type N-terminal cleavage/methylation domain-containing protein
MKARRGYTLLEMMLVLALIVVVGGITFPLAGLLLDSNKVTVAQDQVRTCFVRLRNVAMAQGRYYTFKVMENTGRYKLEPDEETELGGGNGAAPYIVEGELPTGVIFVRDTRALMGSGAAAGDGGAYETWAVFNPDGTSPQDALVIVGMPGHGARAIRIRGLTGAILQVDLNAEGGQ